MERLGTCAAALLVLLALAFAAAPVNGQRCTENSEHQCATATTALSTVSDHDNDAAQCTFMSQRVQCGYESCNRTTHRCQPCTADDQCYQKALWCTGRGQCRLMPLAKHFSGLVAAAAVAGFITCAVAVVAGVGGGAILVVAYNLLMEIPLINAVAFSQSTIAGQSIINVALQMRRYHPKASPPNPTRPVVNYEYLAMLLPPGLLGTVLGELLSRSAPDWTRIATLFLLFTYILVRIVQRMKKQLQEDKIEIASRSATPASSCRSYGTAGNSTKRKRKHRGHNLPVSSGSAGSEDDDDYGSGSESGTPPLQYGDEHTNGEQHLDASTRDSIVVGRTPPPSQSVNDDNPSITSIDKSLLPPPSGGTDDYDDHHDHDDHDENKKPPQLRPQYPIKMLVYMAVLFFLLLGFNVLREPEFRIVKCGTTAFWGIIAGIVFYNSVVFVVVRSYFKKLKRQIKNRLLKPEVLPFAWNWKTTILFPVLAGVAGAAASFLGIGGGLVLSFLLIEARLTPEEVSATGGYATFLIASASCLCYAFAGHLPWDYFLLTFFTGALSNILGQYFQFWIKRAGYRFLIIAALVTIIVGSMVALTGLGIYHTIETVQNHGSLAFGPLCKKV